MKHLFHAIIAGFTLVSLTSCLGDEPDNGSNWRNHNDSWMQAKTNEKDKDGNPVYRRIGCDWDPNAYILMKWHNDPAETASRLSPLSTSTVDVRYEVMTVDSVLVDSSHSRVTPAPGVYRSQLNNNINGWIIGLSNMHIGDTCTILIPYNQAYGEIPYNGLKAYSSLIFNVRLVDIPAYEKPIK